MPLTRRDVLRNLSLGASGAAISPAMLPFMEQLRAHADGDVSRIPKRVVFVVKSSGLTPTALVPGALAKEHVKKGDVKKSGDNYDLPEKLVPAEKLVNASLKGRALPKTLKALEPFKDQMAIVQGLSGKMCKGGHSSWYGALGCYRTGGEHDTGQVKWATIDGELALHMPAIFPHVGLTLGGKVMDSGVPIKNSVVYPGISAIGKDRPLPFQGSPMLAYKDLFGIVASGKGAKADVELKSTLLDFMVDDIKRLDKKIGGAEKEKLGHYLEAFESLRERGRRLKGVEAQVRKAAPVVNDKYTSQAETDRLEAHFDLAAASLISGLTNVVTLRVDTLSIIYKGLGITRGVHGIGHGETAGSMTPGEARDRIRRFHVEQIARLAGKLKRIPEGDGTMLDNTLIVYMSDAAEKHHASCIQWPFVLVGGLGDELKTRGQYLQYPHYGRKGHHTIANLYTSLLHAVGKKRDTFGQMDLNLDKEMQKGPLTELAG